MRVEAVCNPRAAGAKKNPGVKSAPGRRKWRWSCYRPASTGAGAPGADPLGFDDAVMARCARLGA
jgi:hypothetical protein